MPSGPQFLRTPPFVHALSQLEEGQPLEQPLDIIADAFSRVVVGDPKLHIEGTPLGKALVKIAAAFNHQCTYREGFVCMKSQDYAFHRAAQLPAGLYHQLTDQKPEAFGIEECARIAALPDETYHALVDTMDRADTTYDYLFIGTYRGDLLLWSGLSPEQKALAYKQGIGWKDLPSALQELFRIAVRAKRFSPLHTNYHDTSWKPTSLEGATLRVLTASRQRWGYRRPDGSIHLSMNHTEPREKVLAALSKENPGLKIEDLAPVLIPYIEFHYSAFEEEELVHWMQLPLVWQETH